MIKTKAQRPTKIIKNNKVNLSERAGFPTSWSLICVFMYIRFQINTKLKFCGSAHNLFFIEVHKTGKIEVPTKEILSCKNIKYLNIKCP